MSLPNVFSPLIDERDPDQVRWMFFCPGCECGHFVQTKQGKTPGPTWDWNGDVNKPTVSPSLLVQSGKLNAEGHYMPTVCHSFIKDGMIQFLGDCTHKLANQTVELKADV